MGGRRSFLILTVFVSACPNRSRKLLLRFTSQTRKQRARIPKGRWRTGLWAWVFAFWETVTSFPSVQFSHYVMSNCATPWMWHAPGFLVLHQLQELAQTHVH